MILRASYGTLALLDMGGTIVPSQKTAYFMLDGKCVFDCAFCTHARSAKSSSQLLSRIVWKEIDPTEAASRAKNNPSIKRICFQVVSYKGYVDDVVHLLKLFAGKPISISVRATSLEEIELYFKHGADMVGISIDAATEELHRKIRGGSLKAVLDLLDEASKKFPGKIATHLIVGLGETERDMVKIMDWLSKRNITIALFAFTPIKGTKLENHPRPSLESYRRIQIARFLLEKKLTSFESFSFDEDGKITDFGVDIKKLDYKRAFLTSGCPDCTRPFYNESPGKPLYNIHSEDLLDQVPDLSSS